MRGTSSGQLGIFDGLYGFLQVIISQKKPGNAVDNPFLLCWHVESVAGSTDSLKPHALRVPSSRRAGLDRIRSASLGERAPAKQKNAKRWDSRREHASDSEVLSKRKIERAGFRRKPDTCSFLSGVKEVKGVSTSERERRSGSERSGDP